MGWAGVWFRLLAAPRPNVRARWWKIRPLGLTVQLNKLTWIGDDAKIMLTIQYHDWRCKEHNLGKPDCKLELRSTYQ
jgi:hypothetical protein